MREYPVFVPVEGDHVAAIITVPDGEPRGLVALLPGGGGAPRSHRGAMWRVLAHRLEERGIASLRLDWRGVGDSTGEVFIDVRQPPVDDAARALRLAVEATGVDRLGLAGNCYGSRTVLGLAPLFPGTRSLALVMPKPGTRAKRSGGAQARFARVSKAMPWLEAPARRALHGMRKLSKRVRPDGAEEVFEAMAAACRTARMLVLESPAERRDGRLDKAVRSPRRGMGSITLGALPGEGVRAFDTLERQAFVIDQLVDWFDRTIDAEPMAPDRAERAERTA